MTDKPVKRIPSSHFEEKAEKLPHTADEIEVHLAIADFFDSPVQRNSCRRKGFLRAGKAF